MAYLESHRSAMATGFELTFKRMDEIADLLVIDVKIAVPRYAELVATINRESGE